MPYNGEDLQWFPVTPAMSKPDFMGPECCKPLKRQSIATFFKPKQTAKGDYSIHHVFMMTLMALQRTA